MVVVSLCGGLIKPRVLFVVGSGVGITSLFKKVIDRERVFMCVCVCV